MATGLDIGFQLDRRWHLLRGEGMDSKQDDLLALARVLNAAGVEWTLIGGLAYQIHAEEPRTTLDVDLAIRTRSALPRPALEAAGFRATGSFEFTENWVAPQGTPVQFSDEPAFGPALASAVTIDQSGEKLRVVSKLEFVRAKLRAASDGKRRRSKALRDLADLETILEESPALEAELDETDRARRAEARRRVAG